MGSVLDLGDGFDLCAQGPSQSESESDGRGLSCAAVAFGNGHVEIQPSRFLEWA